MLNTIQNLLVSLMWTVSCVWFFLAWIYDWDIRDMLGMGVVFIVTTVRIIADEFKEVK